MHKMKFKIIDQAHYYPDMFVNFKYDGSSVSHGFMLACVFEWNNIPLFIEKYYGNEYVGYEKTLWLNYDLGLAYETNH